jgi:hypothetical protein
MPHIKEKHTQIQYNNNNKIYNVTLYLHCQSWPCWQQTTARVYFKGDKSWQKYIKIDAQNINYNT